MPRIERDALGTVEVPDGATTRLVGVEPGIDADGYVEVAEGELAEGDAVVRRCGDGKVGSVGGEVTTVRARGGATRPGAKIEGSSPEEGSR